MWAAAHLALFVLAWAAAWVYRASPSHAPLTGVFEHWDAALLRNIAQYGYFSPHSTANNTAFFPGYPATLAAAHLILRNWVLAELVVSGIAGCFVVVSLSRLAGGRRAVLYLLTAPPRSSSWSGTPSACSWRSRSPPGTPRPAAGGGVPRCWRDCPGWCARTLSS